MPMRPHDGDGEEMRWITNIRVEPTSRAHEQGSGDHMTEKEKADYIELQGFVHKHGPREAQEQLNELICEVHRHRTSAHRTSAPNALELTAHEAEALAFILKNHDKPGYTGWWEAPIDWSAQERDKFDAKMTALLAADAQCIPREPKSYLQTIIRERDDAVAALKTLRDASEAKEPPSAPPQIPMLLTCPVCSNRHIDEGEFATKVHHTHACQICGTVWRPALVPTVGVQFLPGYKNDAST